MLEPVPWKSQQTWPNGVTQAPIVDLGNGCGICLAWVGGRAVYFRENQSSELLKNLPTTHSATDDATRVIISITRVFYAPNTFSVHWSSFHMINGFEYFL